MPESWTEDDSWTLVSRSRVWFKRNSYLKSMYCSFVFPSSLLTSNNDSDDGVMVSGRRLTRHCQPVLPPCCPWCLPLVWGCSLLVPGSAELVAIRHWPHWPLTLCTLMTWLSLPGSTLPTPIVTPGPGSVESVESVECQNSLGTAGAQTEDTSYRASHPQYFAMHGAREIETISFIINLTKEEVHSLVLLVMMIPLSFIL